VQRVIADTGFPTPRVLASGVAPGLGDAYILMQRIDGKTPLGGLRLGPELIRLPALLRRLQTMLASKANALHAIKPDLMQRALTEAGVHSQVSSQPFRAGIDAVALECPSAGFTDLTRWLDVHTPNPGPT
jgi:predicted component of type VI protein secretion system